MKRNLNEVGTITKYIATAVFPSTVIQNQQME